MITHLKENMVQIKINVYDVTMFEISEERGSHQSQDKVEYQQNETN